MRVREKERKAGKEGRGAEGLIILNVHISLSCLIHVSIIIMNFVYLAARLSCMAKTFTLDINVSTIFRPGKLMQTMTFYCTIVYHLH